MIKAKLLSPDGSIKHGAQELVSEWRETTNSRLWLDLEGELDDEAAQLLATMGCSQLAISDCFRTRHPPKIEVFNTSTFILFRGISQFDESLNLQAQQIGLWVGTDFLISVHRGHSVSVDQAWKEAGDGADALQNPGMLALQLLHFASGRYLTHILDFEDHLADLEDQLLDATTDAIMKELVMYRSRLRRLRRIFSYHHELAEVLLKTGTPHLGSGNDGTKHTRRDLYDRCERLYSLCNMYYEICGDLVEGYISLSSHTLNNTMKVLTIITAVFVPLGFLAGLYGMNFEHMPELQWRYAYFVLLSVMGLLAVTMLVIFRRVRWL